MGQGPSESASWHSRSPPSEAKAGPFPYPAGCLREKASEGPCLEASQFHKPACPQSPPGSAIIPPSGQTVSLFSVPPLLITEGPRHMLRPVWSAAWGPWKVTLPPTQTLEWVSPLPGSSLLLAPEADEPFRAAKLVTTRLSLWEDAAPAAGHPVAAPPCHSSQSLRQEHQRRVPSTS